MSKTWVSGSGTAARRGHQHQRGGRGRGAYATGAQRSRRAEEPAGISGSQGFPSMSTHDYSTSPQDYGGYHGARRSVNDGEFAANSGELDTLEPHGHSGGEQGERKLQKQGAYYVQHPKPSQNQKLRSVAEAEEAAYHQHKTERRAQVTQSLRELKPQSLGGSASDSEETRAKRAREQEREQNIKAKYAGIIQKRKREEYMQAKRSWEDKEIEERKRKQIEKAKQMEVKQGMTEEATREGMRRARLARFDSQK